MNQKTIKRVLSPVDGDDAVNKSYCDTKLSIHDGSMVGGTFFKVGGTNGNPKTYRKILWFYLATVKSIEI